MYLSTLEKERYFPELVIWKRRNVPIKELPNSGHAFVVNVHPIPYFRITEEPQSIAVINPLTHVFLQQFTYCRLV